MEKKSFDIKKVTRINIDEAKLLLKERQAKDPAEKIVAPRTVRKRIPNITRNSVPLIICFSTLGLHPTNKHRKILPPSIG